MDDAWEVVWAELRRAFIKAPQGADPPEYPCVLPLAKPAIPNHVVAVTENGVVVRSHKSRTEADDFLPASPFPRGWEYLRKAGSSVVAVVSSLVILGCGGTPGPTAGGSLPQLPVEVAAAWEKAGAETGWMGMNQSGEFLFVKGSGEVGSGNAKQELIASTILPAFHLIDWRERRFAAAPPPPCGFALCLRLTPTPDAGLKELARLKNLTALDLHGTKVTDAGLKELPALQHLTTLDLGSTQITDAGLKELVGLHNLTTLYVYDTKVTDAGLKELAGLKNLTSLHLGKTKVTNAGMKELGRMKNLSILNLAVTKVTDAGLKELAGLTNLTTLDLHFLRVTNAGLKDVARLTNLTRLDLGLTSVTTPGMKELAGMKRLSWVNLRFTAVNAAGVAELRKAMPQCHVVYEWPEPREPKTGGRGKATD